MKNFKRSFPIYVALLIFTGFGFLWVAQSVEAEGTVATASIGVGATVVLTPTIDNFDDGNDLNLWGGPMGTVPDASIVRTYDDVIKHGTTGRSLKLTYNMAIAGEGYGAFFVKVGPAGPGGDGQVNITADRQLTFWIRGAVGGVEHLKIQLTNASSEAGGRKRAHVYVHDYLDGGITTGWQPVHIPLDAFANLSSLSNVTEITFVFEKSYVELPGSGFAMSGSVYIDDVAITADPLTALRIDHFGDGWGWGALGGNQGSFGTSTLTYDPATFFGAARSLRSVYNVSATPPGNPDFAGHFFILGGEASGWTPTPVNVSRYRYLRLRARANSATENPENLRLEVLSAAGQANLAIVGLTTGWQQFIFDMNAIPGTLDKTTVRQISIVYLRGVSTDQSGVVYFDDIEFSE